MWKQISSVQPLKESENINVSNNPNYLENNKNKVILCILKQNTEEKRKPQH